jgi:hypothetical protein
MLDHRLLYVTVYQFETAENGVTVRHTGYRTRESIEKRGGSMLHRTGKQVSGDEIIEGLWKADPTPVA